MEFQNRSERLERPGMPVPWPAMLDLITSTLMVSDDLEAALTRSRQERFLKDFQQEFAPEVGRKVIRIERHLDFVQIMFSEGVLFRLGDHHLQATGQHLVSRCAHVFARAGSSGYEQIQVEGHTDDIPLDRSTYPSNNWELSTARALSVVEFLSREEPSFAAVLSANGYSSNRPVASNTTQAGRDLNRRIEIRLFFSGTHTHPRGRHEANPR
jgi:flagellar motor protein MotB